MTSCKNRIRLPNFTSAEENLLLILVEQYAIIIESKKTDASTWDKKRKVWEKIDDEFQQSFGLKRGAKNLREKYDNLKRKLKRSLVEGEDELQMDPKKVSDENMKRLAAILELTADAKSSNGDSDDINGFEPESEMPTAFLEITQSYQSYNDNIRDPEWDENKLSNQCAWNTTQSDQSKEGKSASPSSVKEITESQPNAQENFWPIQKLDSTIKHKWGTEQHKRDLEKHQWEMEKYKLLIEKQKLELEGVKFKARILDWKLKTSAKANRSASPAMFVGGHTEITAALDNTTSAISILAQQIKVEPTLDITDVPISYSAASHEDVSLLNSTEARKRFAISNMDPFGGGLHKKRRPTQQDVSEEPNQWDRALTNDMLDVYSADSSCHQVKHLFSAEYDSDFGNTENGEEEAGNDFNGTENDLADEREFLNVLKKHKLQHFFVKLKQMNIGLDCFKAIREVDIRDMFGRDIGARIRFRGLVEDWRASHMYNNTAINHILERDITELKVLIKDQQNQISNEQLQTQGNHEEINPLPQCSQNITSNTTFQGVLPEKPYQTVSEFKAFEDLLQASEVAYKNLVDELISQQFTNTLSFLKSSWRRIMSDNVAKHFCWIGTPEKPAIRSLRVTRALKEAYVRKYSYGSNEEFQRTIISFFQHAKTRLQKKQNYEKIRVAS